MDMGPAGRHLGAMEQGAGMGAYYLRLAWLGLRRNPVLAGLMILAIALGVAMSMSAFTVLAVMARDPIPHKSRQLFAVQLDNGGPRSRKAGDDEPPGGIAWRRSAAFGFEHDAVAGLALFQVLQGLVDLVHGEHLYLRADVMAGGELQHPGDVHRRAGG